MCYCPYITKQSACKNLRSPQSNWTGGLQHLYLCFSLSSSLDIFLMLVVSLIVLVSQTPDVLKWNKHNMHLCAVPYNGRI